MWSLIKERLGPTLVDDISSDILKYDTNIESSEFNRSGKKYFATNFKRYKFLKSILKSIYYPLQAYYKNPLLYHAFILSKSPGGNSTSCHQDIVFWRDLEMEPRTAITFWVPLINVNNKNGCLKLIPTEKTENILHLNKIDKKIYSHKDFKSQNSGFPKEIKEKYILERCKPVEIDSGNWIAFDCYSPHSSCSNISEYHRLALKVVVLEKDNLLKNNKKLEQLLTINQILKFPSFLGYILFLFSNSSRINNPKNRVLLKIKSLTSKILFMFLK